MDIEERFEGLRRSSACAQLSRQQERELVAITAQLIEERRRLRSALARLPEPFSEVRRLLNELQGTVGRHLD